MLSKVWHLAVGQLRNITCNVLAVFFFFFTLENLACMVQELHVHISTWVFVHLNYKHQFQQLCVVLVKQHLLREWCCFKCGSGLAVWSRTAYTYRVPFPCFGHLRWHNSGTFSGCRCHVIGLWHHPQGLSSCQPEYFARTITSGPFCLERLVWKLTKCRKERLVYWNANTWWHILRGSALWHCSGFLWCKYKLLIWKWAATRMWHSPTITASFPLRKLLYVGMGMDHEL